MLKDKLTPKAIVAALNAHIVGQDDAKKAVAVALRNRWRRQQLSPELRDEVTPKNILMIGPTGCGKTEISRRLAKLADAPFVKVEATKFTEVGYVGRDVEQIARDLVEEAVRLERERRRGQGPRRGGGSGDGQAARCADRKRLERSDTAELPPALHRRQPRPGRSRDRGRRGAEYAVRDPRHGRAGVRPQVDHGQGDGAGPAQEAQAQGAGGVRAADGRGGRQAARSRRRQPHRAGRRRSQWDRLPRRDRQDRRQRCSRRLGQPRGRPARPPAADRRHDGRDQIRAAEDRPHPVHRVAARSTSPSRPTCFPSFRAGCRSGWS